MCDWADDPTSNKFEDDHLGSSSKTKKKPSALKCAKESVKNEKVPIAVMESVTSHRNVLKAEMEERNYW